MKFLFRTFCNCTPSSIQVKKIIRRRKHLKCCCFAKLLHLQCQSTSYILMFNMGILCGFKATFKDKNDSEVSILWNLRSTCNHMEMTERQRKLFTVAKNQNFFINVMIMPISQYSF